MRLQLALNVPDLETAVDFYSRLFDTKPHKMRPGYANFVVDEPPLKLVLYENPNADEKLNHLGVEYLDPAPLRVTGKRLREEGLVDLDEPDTVCCHARQEKFWTVAPDNARWEFYFIKDENPQVRKLAEHCCAAGGL